MKKYFLVVTVILIFLSASLYSQKQQWIVYDCHCLSDDKICSIFIDSKDIKWIIPGYGDGIIKFDDKSWTVYLEGNSGLPDNWVNSIAEDSQGNKWLGTLGGLVKFDGTNWTVYDTTNSGIPDNRVRYVVIDANDNKWMINDKGLTRYDGKNWKLYDTSNSGLPYNDICCLKIDSKGNKWMISYDKRSDSIFELVKFDDTNWSRYKISSKGFLFITLYASYIDNDDNFWLFIMYGKDEGRNAIKFDGKNWIDCNIRNYGNIYSIISDKEGNQWFGTDNGLVKYDGIDFTNYGTCDSLKYADKVYDIAIDSKGNKWIAAYGSYSHNEYQGGLEKFDGTSWTYYDNYKTKNPDNPVGQRIESIAIDKQDNKWINSYEIYKFDNTNWSRYYVKDSIFNNSIFNILKIDNIGSKWLVTNNGLVNFDDTYCYDYLYNTGIYDIAFDNKNSKWIATYSKGLIKFDDINWTYYDTSNSGIPFDNIYSIAIDADGNKWIGNGEYDDLHNIFTGGLVKFDGTNWTYYDSLSSGLPNNIITSIAIDKAGNKWLVTKNGLVKFDGTQCTIYNSSNSGLPNDVITALVIDNESIIWIGTAFSGLVKFDGLSWTVYNTNNSKIPSDWVRSIAIDKKNNKWLGFWDSFAVFNETGVDLSASISKIEESQFSIYPNPANNTIKMSGLVDASAYVEIYNLTGMKVLNQRITSNSINISGLSDGMYIVKIFTKDNITAAKLIVKHSHY